MCGIEKLKKKENFKNLYIYDNTNSTLRSTVDCKKETHTETHTRI